MNIRPRFDAARQTAQTYIHDIDKTIKLLDRANTTVTRQKNKIEKFWYEIVILIKMLRAWVRGEYKEISAQSIVAVIAALIYFVNPFDLIFDFIPGIGYLDDATVILFVFNQLRKDIDRFTTWFDASNTLINPPPE